MSLGVISRRLIFSHRQNIAILDGNILPSVVLNRRSDLDLSERNILDFSRGLSRIPDYVIKELTDYLKAELRSDGFGISFPCRSGCQMRLIHNKQNLGGFYSYKQYGGVQKAIKAAMNKNRSLRALLNSNDKAEKSFVYYTARFDKRRGKEEWMYQVPYFKGGKRATKTFSLGYVEPSSQEIPSAEKMLHAFMTARLFRFYFEELGQDFDESCFKDWKTTRLYANGHSKFDWTGK